MGKAVVGASCGYGGPRAEAAPSEDLKSALRGEWKEFWRKLEDEFDLQCNRQELLVARWVDALSPGRAGKAGACAADAGDDVEVDEGLPARPRPSLSRPPPRAPAAKPPPAPESPAKPSARPPELEVGGARGHGCYAEAFEASPSGAAGCRARGHGCYAEAFEAASPPCLDPPPTTSFRSGARSSGCRPGGPRAAAERSGPEFDGARQVSGGSGRSARQEAGHCGRARQVSGDSAPKRVPRARGDYARWKSLSRHSPATKGGPLEEVAAGADDGLWTSESPVSERGTAERSNAAAVVHSTDCRFQAELEYGKPSLRQALYRRIFMVVKDWEEPERTGCLATVVESRLFRILCATVIIAHSVFTFYTSNWEVLHVGERWLSWMVCVDVSFMCFYVAEITMKSCVHRWFLLWCSDWQWNVFDIVLVGIALVDFLLTCLFSTAESKSLAVMRSIRLVKMTNILRMVRVLRFFRELRLILSSLLGCLASLFWSCVMLGLIFFFFSLFFVQSAASHLQSQSPEFRLAHSSDPDVLRCFQGDLVSPVCTMAFFGSVQHTMMTLFMASTGGVDWQIFYSVVREFGTSSSILFIFFMTFMHMALMNILTSVFVEGAMRLAQRDSVSAALEYRSKEISQRAELRCLFMEMDSDRKGFVSLDEFEACVTSGKLKSHLSLLELDVQDTTIFFSMVATTHDGKVTEKEFVDGCMRLKGGATNIDLQLLNMESAIMRETVEDLRATIMAGFDMMHKELRCREMSLKDLPISIHT